MPLLVSAISGGFEQYTRTMPPITQRFIAYFSLQYRESDKDEKKWEETAESMAARLGQVARLKAEGGNRDSSAYIDKRAGEPVLDIVAGPPTANEASVYLARCELTEACYLISRVASAVVGTPEKTGE